MDYEEKYIKYKLKYLELKDAKKNQTGGGKLKNNCFIDKSLFYTHFDIKNRDKRLKDFKDIYIRLKNHLEPKEKAIINKRKMNKYINMHKKENIPLIKKLLEVTQYISFSNFKKNLYSQIERFNKYLEENNIKKYIFCLGVGNDGGGADTDYNIYKSNLWVFLLGYNLLHIKPFDIMLNLKDAFRLYSDKMINNFLLIDDCTYSGSQVVDRVIYSAATELMHNNETNSFLINEVTKKPIFQPIQEKKILVHYIIPYLSKIAYNKLKMLELTTQINVNIYTNNIINSYGDIIEKNLMEKIKKLYNNFIDWTNIENLIPIFFDHKIADSVSTIDLILIKGQVLDNPKKRCIFIDSCLYNKNDTEKQSLNPNEKNFNQKKVYCPIPPYLHFYKYL